MNAERLLNVAKALRESPRPEAFTMEEWGWSRGHEHPCGTPACALGHYAWRTDLQDAFKLTEFGGLLGASQSPRDCGPTHSGWQVTKHFDITRDEADELFSFAGGCGGATTVNQAASYIEQFVADRLPKVETCITQGAPLNVLVTA